MPSLGNRGPEAVTAAATALVALLLTAVVATLVGVVGSVLGADPETVRLLVLVVAGLGLLGTAVLSAGVWLAVRWARDAVGSRSRRLRRWVLDHVRSAERSVPPVRALGLGSLLAPDRETELAALRRRYVEGDLDEEGFERRVAQVLDDDERLGDLLNGLSATAGDGDGDAADDTDGPRARDRR